MPDINDLRRLRAENVEKVQALAAIEAAGTDLDKVQLQQFADLKAENDQLNAKITRAEETERMVAEAAKPLQGLGANGANAGVAATVKKPDIKGAQAARMIMAIGAVGHAGREAAQYAENNFADTEVAAALNTSEGTAGGVLVPQAFMTDIIELLTPVSVVRSLNPILLPMPNGNITIPRIVGGATSFYLGEGDDIEASEQTFGDLELSAKILATLVPVSNTLINYSGISDSIENVIISDMVNSMALREDLAYIRGDGKNKTPTGFRHTVPEENILTASDWAALAKVKQDLGKMELALLNANVKMIRPGWVMNPTVFIFLQDLSDGNGNTVFPDLPTGMFRGKPYRVTTQVPNNLNGSESELYLADFADAVIGESEAVTFAVSTEATYKDPATGQMVSAFTRNQTLIRVISGNDFGMRHEASACVLEGIKV